MESNIKFQTSSSTYEHIGGNNFKIKTMEKKQTAVEWYANASHELIVKKTKGEINHVELLTMHHNLIQQAKQMEKEQIIEADLAGVERTLLDFSKFPNLVGDLKETLSLVNDMKEGRDTHDNGIEYYNETYGKTKN
jgi:hypothetical protein